MTDSLKDVVAFLLGEGSLDGVWFGDKPAGERGQFWWRKQLRAASISALAAPVVSDDAACILRDLVEALDGAFISSWQSTAAWSDQLNVAREHLAALSPGRSGEVSGE